MTNATELKDKFWHALDKSPFLFLSLDSHPHSAVPMTAQLDEDAQSAIWFFTGRDNEIATGGPVTATFAGKGHDIFARFTGQLSTESDRARIDQFWSPVIEAWFPRGKNDPNMLLMRMDLDRAEIWNSDLGLIDNVKMLMGFDSRTEAMKEHVETAL